MSEPNPQQQLAHVLWIGGAPTTGKTTAATSLAERHNLRIYHFDRREPFHIYRSLPERQPHIIAFMAMTMDQRWVSRTPEAMAENTIASWGDERFPMVIEDLLRLGGEGPILAEGPGLFPERVAPLLSDPRRAIWLVPTLEWLTTIRSSRQGGIARETSDPPRALRNIIARDALIAAHIRREAESRDLTVVEVDEKNIADIESILERQFAPYL